MPVTFLQFKQAVRSRVFVSGESRNLRIAHDKSIVDALVDVQRWVECLQNNNTHLVPHCATYFKCGLTSFDFPRAMIRQISVLDKANEIPSGDVTASKSGTEVTSSAPFFNQSMVGAVIKFSSGSSFRITEVVNDQLVTVTNISANQADPGETIIAGGSADSP